MRQWVMFVIVAVQLASLVVGVLQGYRYRHSVECFEKSFFPWLLVGIMGAPLLFLIKAMP